MDVKCEVSFDGFEEKLKQIGPKLARKTLRRAVSKVGDMWVEDMQSRVPVDSGDLRESIVAKVSTSNRGGNGQAKVSVGPMFDTKQKDRAKGSQNPGVYGMFVEFGTKRTKAEPYMRPTFDATSEKAIQMVADSLKEDLEDLLKG